MAVSQSSLAESKFSVPTSQHGSRFSQTLKYIVIHTAECCSGLPRTAFNLAQWLQNGRPGSGGAASWHYNVDSEFIVQSLDERYIGYHVGNSLNNNSLGIEMTVYASANKEEWLSGHRAKTMENTARLTADLCERHNIPMLGLGNTTAREGKAGVLSHSLARKVWGGNNVRTDPGAGFPWQNFMDRVREIGENEPAEPVLTKESTSELENVFMNTQPYAIVQGFYRTYLGREGTKNEISSWLNAVDGWDKQQVEKIHYSIKNSEEANKA